jgi:hypothetical protein
MSQTVFEKQYSAVSSLYCPGHVFSSFVLVTAYFRGWRMMSEVTCILKASSS